MSYSKDVYDLNPELRDAEMRRKLAGRLDRADDLRDALWLHAPDLAMLFTRDLPFLTFRVDLGSQALMLAIEVDGGLRRAGGGKHATSRDLHKQRELALAGWLLLRFSSTEVYADPLGCIDYIRRAVAARQAALSIEQGR